MTILLDIDGVMVPAAGWKAPELGSDGFPNFSAKAVYSLNKIISSTDAAILLTSSHKSNYDLEAWKRIFADRGVSGKISKLETSKKNSTRIEEVLTWVRSHPSETNFVIIDDDKSLNNLPPAQKNKLVLTSPLIGLTEALADQAISVLRNTNPISASV